MALTPVWSRSLGPRIGQCRAAPVTLAPGRPPALLVAWSADFDVNPFIEMFFFPTDTLKLALFSHEGERLWEHDLGPAVVPGQWFCPVYPFDLDGDGCDEIYLVTNTDLQHPLSAHGRVLEAREAATGRVTGRWPWPMKQQIDLGVQFMGLMFRNFIAGGTVEGRRVLVTAQGTYGDLYLAGFGPGMAPLWERLIPRDAPGARGSHYCPVLDLDGSGRDVILYGERAIELADGSERFCADRGTYQGHSDIIAPFWLGPGGGWRFLTCRESDAGARPRICVYDAGGRRLWGALEEGHIDMGWAARLGPDHRPVVHGVRIGAKHCGPDGRFHDAVESFAFDARDGEALELPFDPYRTIPVDWDGCGSHKFVRGQPSGDGALFHGDGTLSLWRDEQARDSERALHRYRHPFYQSAARSTAVGGQMVLLGGL